MWKSWLGYCITIDVVLSLVVFVVVRTLALFCHYYI